MKLVSIAAVLIYITVKVQTQSLQHEQFPFPPKFQTPNTPSDNSLYLPPENHSPLPYYSIKNVNNLQFPYLPPTGTKAPTIYPTPFPMLLSSPLVPNFDDDEEEDNDFNGGKNRVSSPHPQKQFNQQSSSNNRTQSNPSSSDKKEPRVLPKTVTYRHPIDRADIKLPFQMGPMPSQMNQAPASRRHMIVTAEMSKDQLPISDQVKTASYQGLQYIPAPPGFISSTTEPAIPILRLSNEMDLDGSFSYEALGADQTHYVQHSRMENMGTEKEEQVVEGSYSYVGDNGQTYTVHYVADSNGFRASGDHLPVPPPVPEIIQRAIQYNLAEEAKRPPHLKSSWEEEAAKDNERPKNFNHIFSNTPPPPPRTLFTGKQPEAFSYNFAQQGPNVDLQNNNNNNLVAAASNQAPVKTVDYQEQTQNKPVSIAPISPQITFLASQGAHLPSVNSNQQSISRMYINAEKAPLPQLMNYEAAIKENEQENNKALWRWQYGANANNINPVKNSISRSSGEGDDVMINFSDMTQEDYTNMIRSQIEPSHEIEAAHPEEYTRPKEEHQHRNPYNEYAHTQISSENHEFNDLRSVPEQNTHAPLNFSTQVHNTASTVSFPHSNDWYNKRFDNNNVVPEQVPTENKKSAESRKLTDAHPNIITQKHFVPKSQTVTQSYDYEDSFFDVRKIKSYKHDNQKIVYDVKHEDNTNDYSLTTLSNMNNKNWFNKENNYMDLTPMSTYEPPTSTTSKVNLKFSDFIVKEQSTDFRPIEFEKKITSTSTTTAISVEDIFENNIFLKNLVRSNKNTAKKQNIIPEDPKQQFDNNETKDTKHFYNNVPSEPQYQKINEPQHVFQPENSKHQLYQKINSDSQQIYQEPHIEPQQINIKDNSNQQMLNKFNLETHNTIQAEPKQDKTPKFISLHQKPLNEVKLTKMKPMDMSEVLNYVAMKNQFESSKIRPKSNPIFLDFNQRKELHYSDLEENKNEESNHNNKNKLNAELQQVHNKVNNEPQQVYNIRKTLNPQQQEELRGIIKNYKVLHRNNNQRAEQDNSVRKELNTIPFRMMQMQSPNLPPLGRAGPTVKTYLPAIYV